MPRRRRAGKTRWSLVGLTGPQWSELLLGPYDQHCAPTCRPPMHEAHCRRDHTAFASAMEREEAWFALREEFVHGLNMGSRPWAFWEHEVGFHLPMDEKMPWLAENGQLTRGEMASLVASAPLYERHGHVQRAAAICRERLTGSDKPRTPGGPT